MNKNLLKQYARLVAGVGINVQKGQTVVVRCPVDCADFGRALCAACFELGAKDVVMDWRDDVCSREHWRMPTTAYLMRFIRGMSRKTRN